MGELGRDWLRGVGVTVPVTGGGGTTKLGRYVGHWSVQKLGVGGSEGRQGGRGKGGGGGAWGLREKRWWVVGGDGSAGGSRLAPPALCVLAVNFSWEWGCGTEEGEEACSACSTSLPCAGSNIHELLFLCAPRSSRSCVR